jgi:hypothetical protein
LSFENEGVLWWCRAHFFGNQGAMQEEDPLTGLEASADTVPETESAAAKEEEFVNMSTVEDRALKRGDLARIVGR